MKGLKLIKTLLRWLKMRHPEASKMSRFETERRTYEKKWESETLLHRWGV